jgi:hypothetical protein
MNNKRQVKMAQSYLVFLSSTGFIQHRLYPAPALSSTSTGFIQHQHRLYPAPAPALSSTGFYPVGKNLIPLLPE